MPPRKVNAVPAAGLVPAAGRRPRVLPRVAVLLAVAAGLLAVPAHAAGPPALTARTTVTGSRTGWTRVTLTRPLPVDGVPSISVDRPGSFTGVALVRERKVEPEAAYVVRHQTAAGTVYRYGWAGLTSHQGNHEYPMYARRVLPPGTYRLYLLASGPVTAKVTWQLPGRAASVLRPSNATASHDVQQSSPGVPGVAVAPSHSLGGTNTTSGRTLLVGYSWFAGTVSTVEAFGSCMHDGPDLAPMAPACPNNNVGLIGIATETPTAGISIGYAYVRGGRWLMKSYFTLGGHLTDGGNAVYWLDLGAGFPA